MELKERMAYQEKINAKIAEYRKLSTECCRAAENHAENFLELYENGIRLEKSISLLIRNLMVKVVGKELAGNYLRKCDDVLDRIYTYQENFVLPF